MAIRSGGDQPIFAEDWVACMSAHFQQTLIDGDLDNARTLHDLLEQLGMSVHSIAELEAAVGFFANDAPLVAEPVTAAVALVSEAASSPDPIMDFARESFMPITEAEPLMVGEPNGSDSALETIRAQTEAVIVTVAFGEPLPVESLAADVEPEVAASVTHSGTHQAADPVLLSILDVPPDPLIPTRPNKPSKKGSKPVPKPDPEADKNQLSLF